MCRITGFWDRREADYDRRSVLRAMRESLAHGGPDSSGEYFDLHDQLALGHRRLAVIDLQERANQPMIRGSLVLVYNGECYNFREVRDEHRDLGQYTTESDTELILLGLAKHGPAFMHQLRGMYGFAVWDQQKKSLLLCRDRLGVKPMYWYLHDGLFMFASEVKAFHQHPRFNASIDHDSVHTFLSYGYIPQPRSIYKHVRKLPPGHFLFLDEGFQPRLEEYWSATEACFSSTLEHRDEDEAADDLQQRLVESVNLRMVADVPVGVFLSGGVDSSLVTAALQGNSGHRLKTFTIGFERAEFNEAERARKIASHLGTEHHELTCTENEFADIVPRIPEIADEPFGDASIIPTFLLSEFTRQHVTVSLSADGGDELFGGYTKYQFVNNWYPRLSRVPLFMRKLMQGFLSRAYRVSVIRSLVQWPLKRKFSNVDAKLMKLIRTLDASSQRQLFAASSQYATAADFRALMNREQLRTPDWGPDIDPERRISYLGLLDIQHYLEGDILTKVDRASMAVALEGRDPLLDHELVEFALRLPDRFKLREGNNKFLLRKVLARYLPDNLMESVKFGFTIPLAPWLRNRFADQLRSLPHDQAFLEAFQFDSKAMGQTIDAFIGGKNDRDPMLIWFIFILHLWHQRWSR